MLIEGLTNSGAMPALEAVMRFAGARQRVLAHNVANLTTPDFEPRDLSVRGFQAALSRAVHARRASSGGMHGELALESTRELQIGGDGRLVGVPGTHMGGVLGQDRNSRDLERLMQGVAENSAAFRMASDLMRQQTGMLRGAIGERVA